MDTQTRNVLPVSLAFLFLAALALLSIIGTTIWLVHRSQLYFNDVIEARDIRSAVVELRNDVQIAESSRRGFLATGNEIYLAPYDTAKLHAELDSEVGARLTHSRVSLINIVLSAQ